MEKNKKMTSTKKMIKMYLKEAAKLRKENNEIFLQNESDQFTISLQVK